MNQKIDTKLGTVIIVIIAITAGVFVWKIANNKQGAEQLQTVTVRHEKTYIVAQIPETNQQDAEWKTYKNKDLELSFNYPANWGEVIVENGNGNKINIPPCKPPMMMLYRQKLYPWGIYNTVFKFSKAPIDVEIKLLDLHAPNLPKQVCNIKGDTITVSAIQPKAVNEEELITNKAGIKFIYNPSLFNSINTSIEGPTYAARDKNNLVWIGSVFAPYSETPEEIELREYTQTSKCQRGNAYNTEKVCGIIAWYQSGKTAEKIHIAFNDLKEIVQTFSFSLQPK